MLGSLLGQASYSIAGPLPNDSETADFFGAQLSRERIFWQSMRGPAGSPITPDWLFSLGESCKGFEIVECWFDPDVDGQLNLVHLLNFARHDLELVSKIRLVHPDEPVGGEVPVKVAAWGLPTVKFSSDHLAVARQFWSAYRQPTPEMFAGLHAVDLSALPHLPRTVPLLLSELPAVETGLSVTETRILTIVGRPEMTWHTLFQTLRQEYGHRVFLNDHEEDALDRLGSEPNPAVLGVMPDPIRCAPGAFDKEAFTAHRQGRLSLSEFGQALLEGREDFPRLHPVHRWWGNTELTNTNLWRWDPVNQELQHPV